ncbi:hypothetical protein, partial [Xanthomonas oryzae]|uniref:hypothetical protein n=1 Tax=Xanthomonas oryzae TaxID=347 RepID=UPI001C52D7FD
SQPLVLRIRVEAAIEITHRDAARSFACGARVWLFPSHAVHGEDAGVVARQRLQWRPPAMACADTATP